MSLSGTLEDQIDDELLTLDLPPNLESNLTDYDDESDYDLAIEPAESVPAPISRQKPFLQQLARRPCLFVLMVCILSFLGACVIVYTVQQVLPTIPTILPSPVVAQPIVDTIVSDKGIIADSDKSQPKIVDDVIPSPHTPLPQPPSQSISTNVMTTTTAPRFLAISRHSGTTADLLTLAERMGFSGIAASFHPFTPFMKDHAVEHNKWRESALLEALCHEYDIIAVSDVIWDGSMFIESDSVRDKCLHKLLFVATNRFDTLILDPDRHKWTANLNNILKQNDYQYPVVVANNPFESLYMKQHGIQWPSSSKSNKILRDSGGWLEGPNVPVIRSFGVGHVPLDLNVKRVDNPPICLYYKHDPAAMAALKYAKSKMGFRHECKLFSMPYGGATYLLSQNAPFVFIPYQVSVMKMWENVIAGGIITLIPTPRLLTSLMTVHYEFRHIRDAIDTVGEVTHDKSIDMWSHYIDFYTPQYEPCSMQFDSFETLNKILQQKTWRNKLQGCQKYARLYADAQLVKWHLLFQERFPHIPLPAYTPIQKEAAKTLLRINI